MGGESSVMEAANGAAEASPGLARAETDMIFETFDNDGDGTIDMVELMQMVATAKSADISSLDQARIKEEWDNDGDGEITKEEFHQRLQRLAKTRPALLGKFQAAAAAKKEAAETEDHPVEVDPVA